jgi:hypothetical protein
MKRIALPHIAVSVVVDPLFFYLLFAISPFSIFFFLFFSFPPTGNYNMSDIALSARSTDSKCNIPLGV